MPGAQVGLAKLRKYGPSSVHRRETERALVLEARRLGSSWHEISGALGCSRQAVWERWRSIDAETDHENACTASSGGRFAYIVPSGFPADPLKYVLKKLGEVRTWNVEWERVTVRQAREQGASWEAIGKALGQTRQAVWERHRSD